MKTETKAGPVLNNLRQIPLPLIVESKTNPRTNFDPEDLATLQASIAAKGIEEPLIVRPVGGKFELVAGARRTRCARTLKLETVPCIVRDLTDAQVQEAQWTSFLHEGISDLEEAETFKRLIELQPGKNQEEKIDALSAKVGLKRSTILGRLALLKLPDHVRSALASGEISQSVAQLAGTVPDVKAQKEIVASARRGASFRDIKDDVDREYRIDLKKAPFDPENAALGCKGPCSKCEHFGANLAAKYPELKLRPDVCTYGDGYREKLRAQEDVLRARYTKEGLKVLSPAEVKKCFPYSDASSPSYSCGYVDPAEKNYHNGESRTWREILGKHAPADVIALHAGRAWKLWPQGEVKRIIDEHKLLPKSSHSSSYAEAAKVAAAKQRIQTKIDLAVAKEAVQRVEKGALNTDAKQLAFMRLIAREVLKQSCADGQRLIIQSRGWTDAKQHDVGHKANDLTAEQCVGVLAEMLFHHGMRGQWGLEKSRAAALKILGVDAGAITKRVKAEIKAKEKKPAKAKTPKPQPKKKGKK